MMTHNSEEKRGQIQMFCIDELVPQDHLLRIIDKAIDWTYIYGLVKDKYSKDTGRPSMAPVTLIKIPFIQYLYGIRSMRQTIKEIEVTFACMNLKKQAKIKAEWGLVRA
jgi:transposase